MSWALPVSNSNSVFVELLSFLHHAWFRFFSQRGDIFTQTDNHSNSETLCSQCINSFSLLFPSWLFIDHGELEYGQFVIQYHMFQKTEIIKNYPHSVACKSPNHNLWESDKWSWMVSLNIYGDFISIWEYEEEIALSTVLVLNLLSMLILWNKTISYKVILWVFPCKGETASHQSVKSCNSFSLSVCCGFQEILRFWCLIQISSTLHKVALQHFTFMKQQQQYISTCFC